MGQVKSKDLVNGHHHHHHHSHTRKRTMSNSNVDILNLSISKSERSERGTSFHEQLVRERDKKTSFEDIYEILEEIGQGGLCKIYKIQKRDDQIGGSSRPMNQRKKKFHFTSASPRRFAERAVIRITNNDNHHSAPPLPGGHERKPSIAKHERKPSTSNLVPPAPSFPPPEDHSNHIKVGLHSANPSTTSLASVSSKSESPMCFALKIINLALVKEDKIDQLKNEVEILKALDHKNIIKAYETFQSKATKKLMIVMELCTGGDLRARMPYTEYQAAIVTQQILSAVSYMHKKSIIHRDMKLENVVFENKHPMASIRVIDFGLSKEYSPNDNILSERVGTLYSMSPETLKGDYTYKADLWSIGVCVYMLLSNGQQPFDGKTPKQLVAKILKGTYDFEDPVWENVSEEAKDFVRALLVVKAGDRLSADEAIRHSWIQTNEKKGHQPVDEDFKQQVRECIIRYSEYGDFMKLAMNVIAKKSTSEEIFHLRRVFEEFDTGYTGTLTFDEFKAALSRFDYSEEDIETIFRKIDINQNNEINYTEFLASTLETQGVIEEHKLAEAFDLMDTDDSGYISKANLRQIMGEHCDEKYIERIIREIGCEKNGKCKISYADFCQAFELQNKKKLKEFYNESSHFAKEHSPSSSLSSTDQVLETFGIVGELQKSVDSPNSANSNKMAVR